MNTKKNVSPSADEGTNIGCRHPDVPLRKMPPPGVRETSKIMWISIAKPGLDHVLSAQGHGSQHQSSLPGAVLGWK